MIHNVGPLRLVYNLNSMRAWTKSLHCILECHNYYVYFNSISYYIQYIVCFVIIDVKLTLLYRRGCHDNTISCSIECNQEVNMIIIIISVSGFLFIKKIFQKKCLYVYLFVLIKKTLGISNDLIY